MKTRILGIDPGRSTGYCLLNDGNVEFQIRKSYADCSAQPITQRRRMMKIIKELKPDVIIVEWIEGLGYKAKRYQHLDSATITKLLFKIIKSLTKHMMIVAGIADELNIPCYGINQSIVFGEKKRKYKHLVKTDENDAFVIAMCGYEENQKLKKLWKGKF